MFSVCIMPRVITDLHQWDYILSNFKPDKIYLLGIPFEPTSNPMRDAPQIKSVDELPTNAILVLMSPKTARHIAGTVSLHDFKHPKNAIYMFGPENENLMLGEEPFGKREPGAVVYIPTDTHDEMYAPMACAVTLWDRRSG